MTELIADRLRRRVRANGAAPLLTYYDLGSGERTELSAVTLANWVAKTANLLVDELDLQPGDAVELALARSAPGHWVTLVWELACWTVGAVVDLRATGGGALAVTGPPGPDASQPGRPVLVCSLHPLGLGLPTAPPIGVIDYALEVRAQPDVHAAVPQSGLAPAWRDASGTRTQAQLLEHPYDRALRRLVRPTAPWTTTAEALIEPLLTGGSTVLVAGPASPDDLRRLADQERAELPST